MYKIFAILLFIFSIITFVGCDPNLKNECKIQCQNGGTCENAACKCPAGYSGADCSTIDTPPADTIYFSVNGVSFSKGTIASITPTSAYVLSDFRSITGVQVVDHGHCWSKVNPLPTISDNHKSYGTMASPQSFTTLMDNLDPNTVYYVRTYCIVNGTTYYHERAVAFTTLPPQAPVLTTGSVSNITTNSAFITGSIDNLGTYPIITYGHCWSVFGNPTINDSKTTYTSNNTAITFNSILSGLSEYKTYFVRSYAINSNGQVFYGNEQFFITESSIAVVGGLLSYYTFDDGTGADLISNFNGNLYGPVPSNDTPKGIGSSMSFDGVDDYMHVVQTRNYSNYSVNLWMKTSDPYGGLVMAQAGNCGWSGLSIDGSKVSTIYKFDVDISTILLNNQWHMLTFVYDGNQNIGSYYIDGVLRESKSSCRLLIDNVQTYYGGRINCYANYFTGKLDNIRMYNRVLSLSEIQELYILKE